MPTQQIVRMKMGFRFSTGTIAVKDSVQVNLSWDDSEAVAYKTLKLKIKPSFIDGTNNVFESAFGLYLPNSIEVGFVSISGMPDILPWFELPYDFWDLVGFIPKVGSYIASAQDQIGVNMNSKAKLPIGTDVEYHDTRYLISFSLADFITDAKKEEMVNKIVGKIPSSTKTLLINTIKAAKKLDDAGAQKFVKDLIGKGLEQVGEMASLTIKGDPSYKIRGHSIVLMVKYWIPGKMSGTYPIEFRSENEEFTLSLLLPPFIHDGDKLYVTIEDITYNFTLEQNLNFKVAIGTIPLVKSPEFDVVNTKKVVTYAQVKKSLTTNDFLLQIPINKSSERILGYKIKAGVTTATAWWASPDVPLKGTVKVYKDNQLIAQKTEQNFTTSHQVQFANLSANTTYKFVMTSIDGQGNVSPEYVLDAKTLEKSPYSFKNHTDYTYSFGTCTLTNPNVTVGVDSITFTWQTNVPASTEVMIGLSQDFSQDYIGYFKRGIRDNNGNYSSVIIDKGYFGSTDSPGNRVLETNHSITITGLEPGTTYYYRIASWLFANNNDTQIVNDPLGHPLNVLEYISSTTTKLAPMVTIICSRSTGVPAKNVPIIISKDGNNQIYYTDENGKIEKIIVEKGKQYIASVNNHPFYRDKSITLTIPAQQEGLMLAPITLDYKNPSGGYVYDSRGNPIEKATGIALKGSSPISVTTNAKGFYNFNGDLLGKGTYTLTARKDGYRDLSFTAEANEHGVLIAKPVTLKSNSIVFAINAKTPNNIKLANASIVVKEGEQVKAQTNANVGGFANIVLPGYTDANEHTFVITVAPPSTGGIPDFVPTTITVSAFADDFNTIQAVCQYNTEPPVLQNIAISRVSNSLVVSAQSDRPTKFSIKHIKPDGSSTSTAFVHATVANSKYQINKTLDMSTQLFGKHTFVIYAMDKYSVKTYEMISLEKEWEKLDVASGPVTYPQFNVKNDSIEFQWKAWYKEDEFGKYVLILENPAKTIEISNYETIRYTLSGISPATLYCGTFKVFAKDGSLLYAMQNPQRFCVSTSSLMPVISNVLVTPNPVGTSREIRYSATVSDPDTNLSEVSLILKKVEAIKDKNGKVVNYKQISSTVLFENSGYSVKSTQIFKTFVVQEPGTYQLVLNVKGPSRDEVVQDVRDIEVLQELDPSVPNVLFEIPTSVSLKESMAGNIGKLLISVDKDVSWVKLIVDWGDGKSEDIPIDYKNFAIETVGKEGKPDYGIKYSGSIPLVHAYDKAGSYKLYCTIEAEVNGKVLKSSTNAQINITE